MTGDETPIGLRARRTGGLRGTARVPGDKSVSHRALIIGSLAVGETVVTGLLESRDVLDTARAMRAFGAQVDRCADDTWRVHGVGVGGFAEPDDVIDFGNSGTGARLVIGAAATQPVTATYTGDRSLRARPMGRVIEPMTVFGARCIARSGGRLPLTMSGAESPVPADYRSPHASAQVKSAVLLAGLNAPGITRCSEAIATRDHTERMLADFGAEVGVDTDDGRRTVFVRGQPELRARPVNVPSDPSSAAFPVCAALIAEGSDVTVPGVSRNPTRDGLYRTLLEMGADITFSNGSVAGGEPVADVRARFGALQGVVVPPERAPSMIDEYPVLAAVAACAEGATVMHGIGELRVKESDRIDAVARGLEANGVRIEEEANSLVVHGCGAGGVPGGGLAESRLDHRIAMSFLCLGLAARNAVAVDDCTMIGTSFPGFVSLMRELGAEIAEAGTGA